MGRTECETYAQDRLLIATKTDAFDGGANSEAYGWKLPYQVVGYRLASVSLWYHPTNDATSERR